MEEVDKAAKVVSSAADPDANIIFGATIKEDQLDQIVISVIATGFDQTRTKFREYAGLAPGLSTGVPQQPSYNQPQPPQQPQYQQPQPQQPQQQSYYRQDDYGQQQPQQSSQPTLSDDDDDKDQLEIPAFLRRIS
jgi:cell division protein FtsZ